ncbi:MAG: hypothetical protein AB7H80_12500 [Candidatus Kapaibacterium sp.]
MKVNRSNVRVIAGISIPLGLLTGIISLIGLLTPDFYFKETANWQAQSVGQDIINLCVILPALIATTIGACKRRPLFLTLWGGTLLYLLYTFTIYSFALHFNALFLLYCLALGFSFYGLLYLFFLIATSPAAADIVHKNILKLTGIYFLVIAILFYVLWLSEILPSTLQNRTPQSLTDVGLLTNPVHVLDISVLLPGLFITGVLLLRGNRFGLSFAPIFLAFTILMNITIGGLILVMKEKGIPADLSLTFIMGALALLSLTLLIRLARNSNSSFQTTENKTDE